MIATAIAIIAGFLSWFFTTYYSIKEPEVLKILPETKIFKNESGWYLRLQAINVGKTAAEIYKVEVLGQEELNVNIIINPAETKTTDLKLTKEYSYNTWYSVRLYLKSGTIYHAIEYRVLS